MKKLVITLLLSSLILSCTQNVISYSELEIIPQKSSKENQKIEIEVGETVQVEGKVAFSDGKSTTDVIWKSENEKIAKVDSQGKIEGITPGKVNITLAAKQDPNSYTQLELIVNPLKEKNVEVSNDDNIKLSKEDQDYLDKVQSEINKTNQTTQEEKAQKPYPVTFLNVNIYDNNGDLVKNVNLNASSLTTGLSWSYSKKLDNGFVLLEDVPNESLIQLSVSKDNWISRKKLVITKGEPRTKPNPIIVNFGGTEQDKFYSLQNQPEISKVLINSQEISISTNQAEDFLSAEQSLSSPIKFKEPLRTISLYFNESIDKSSIEDNFEIISQKAQNGNFLTFNKTNSLSFNWDSNSQKVDINTNIVPTQKTNYRLYFKNSFKDLEGNYSIQGKYISFPNQEVFSDYIDITLDK